jgi:hypothetical protein
MDFLQPYPRLLPCIYTYFNNKSTDPNKQRDTHAGDSRFELAPNLLPNMLGKLDFALLPTERDVIRVKNDICTTEQRLMYALLGPISAQKMVVQLEREVEMMRAWIAPIRRVNTDILSLIFEICCEDDWKTPLRIAATSRDWRNLVLAPPRAWEFLPVRKRHDIKMIKLFLERSHPRPLHFYLPKIVASSF